jgi:nicotinamide-nucleotide amidase
MNAHIITIGDEILIGQTLNTNAAYIGNELIGIQIDILKSSVVGDEQNIILQEFEEVYSRNDLIIVTGGLGPTSDDLTRECIVKFFNTELVLNQEVLEDIKARFQKRGWKLTPLNEDQANVPANAEVMRNYFGTAPGYWIETGNKIFIAMPGVPYEMKEMMRNFVIPRLKEKQKDKKYTVLRRNILTTGIGESALFEKLGDIKSLVDGGSIAFLPSQFGVKLRITFKDRNPETAQNKLTEIEQKIRSKIGRYIFANEEVLLEEVVGRLLKERGLKIAIAESCTGGNLSNLLTNVSGSSIYFERGIISYSNGSKHELLRVNEDTIARYGAVSMEVALQMAEGIKSTSGTDIGMSLTGIMGPTGASAGKPVGLVFIGLCDDKFCTARKFTFGEDRILNKQRTTQAALEMLRKYLLGIPFDD